MTRTVVAVTKLRFATEIVTAAPSAAAGHVSATLEKHEALVAEIREVLERHKVEHKIGEAAIQTRNIEQPAPSEDTLTRQVPDPIAAAE